MTANVEFTPNYEAISVHAEYDSAQKKIRYFNGSLYPPFSSSISLFTASLSVDCSVEFHITRRTARIPIDNAFEEAIQNPGKERDAFIHELKRLFFADMMNFFFTSRI